MRKLASVQEIWKIEPIEGADKIELAHVLGWQCVINKGQFKPKDKAIYFEIDSFLPVQAEFEFLRKSSYVKSTCLGEGFRLRTMKFRGHLSQGLLLPLSVFTQLHDLSIGDDLTEVLGIRKWEEEERITTEGTIIGGLPRSIPHTEEVRIQANPEILKEFRGLDYYISTKLDGASHSLSLDEEGFHVTSHNCEYSDDGKNGFYNLVKKHGYMQKMEALVKREGLCSLAIQGELCAPNIQKNRLKLSVPQWFVFTVILDGKRVGLSQMKKVCDELGMCCVPIEEVGTNLPEKYPGIEDLLIRSDGEYPNGGKKEGIVIRPTEPVYSTNINGYLSFKVVNNKYLLKQ